MLVPTPALGEADRFVLADIERVRDDLTAAGILQSVGRTRARYYTAGPSFPEPVLTEARTPSSLVDPYRR